MSDGSLGFDSVFLQRLERLAIVSRQTLPGDAAGPRRSPRHGASVEFADFREYAPGDDMRRIDWNVYARLDRLFLRLYRAEEMTTLTLLLDRSASMQVGEPAKALTAARLAAVFAYIALYRYDRVAVAAWGETLDHALPVQSGTAAIPLVWRHLERLLAEVGGGADFGALHDLPRYRRGAGVAIVISDFLTDTDWRRGLRSLRAARQDTTVVQLLAPEELNPPLRGDWTLRDMETGGSVDVTVTPRLLKRYAEELEAHTAQLREFCRREGMVFMRLGSDVPLTEVVLTRLRAAGVVG